jgi:hypothetical protein
MRVALVTHHAMRMRRIVLSSVASPPLPYFSTLSHKRNNFREKFDSLHNSSQTLLIPRSIQRDVVINVRRCSCKTPRYSCRILMKTEFSQQNFQK